VTAPDATPAPATETISVVVGPDTHGVVRHATTVAAAAGVPVARFADVPTPADVAALAGPATIAHLHYTDRLFGPNAATAAARVRDLATRLDRHVVISLHDVPELDGTPHSTLRVTAYRLVASCADAIVVASNHEHRRLRRCGIDTDVHVIPLPIEHRAGPPPTTAPPVFAGRSVGVLGFVYPGKGHADVIEASTDLPPDVTVQVLGEASDGHHDMVPALAGLAGRHRRRLAVSGFLDDATLTRALAQVDVPVVPAPTMSASASLGTWIGAGRRPLVAANDYTREVASVGPGLVTLYDPHRANQLAAALSAALADPGSTWHGERIPDVYSWTAVGRSHRCLYRDVAGRP